MGWQDVVPALSVDIIFDTVGATNAAELAYKTLRDGGSFVTIAGALASNATARSRPYVKQHFFLTNSSDYRQLDTLAGLVDSGKLKPVIDKSFTTKDISACFNYSMSGHTTGKSSMVPSSPSVIV